MNLPFDYAARTVAPLRTKNLIVERNDDTRFVRIQLKRVTLSESPGFICDKGHY